MGQLQQLFQVTGLQVCSTVVILWLRLSGYLQNVCSEDEWEHVMFLRPELRPGTLLLLCMLHWWPKQGTGSPTSVGGEVYPPMIILGKGVNICWTVFQHTDNILMFIFSFFSPMKEILHFYTKVYFFYKNGFFPIST